MKRPPYKKGSYVYLVHMYGGFGPRYVEVVRVKYLGYNKPRCKHSYPTLLLGGTRTRPQYYPAYTGTEFNPRCSGMTICLNKADAISKYNMHRNVILKERYEFVEKNQNLLNSHTAAMIKADAVLNKLK